MLKNVLGVLRGFRVYWGLQGFQASLGDFN